jgi:regulator of ribonuclease activity A
VAADSEGAGENGIGVNFAGVSFFDDDFIYADSTGIVLSAEELELEVVEV